MMITHCMETEEIMKKEITPLSLFSFLVIECIFIGIAVWIYCSINMNSLPEWLYKISFVSLVVSPFTRMVYEGYKLYWSGKLDETTDSNEDSEKHPMKIYGSSNE